MIASAVIISLTLLLIILSILFFPKIKIGKVYISTFWVISLLSAVLLLSSLLVPAKDVFNALIDNTAPINPLKILVLFFSMTFISIFLEKAGLFSYLAYKASNKSKNSQLNVFIIFYALVSILTIFTSNDIVILTFTPFICYFCKKWKINPLPYLVAEFVAANTWSMMFIIGNPTNMYLASYAGITFVDYFLKMAIPTLVSGILEFALIILLFKKSLSAPLINSDNNNENIIKSKSDVIVGFVTLFICLLFLIISSYINVEMYLVSLICGVALFAYYLISSVIKKQKIIDTLKLFKHLPFELIPFVISMFIIVYALIYQGIGVQITNFLGDQNVIWTYGYSSLLASNLFNNIPMSILYSSLLSESTLVMKEAAIYSSIIGSNIGAFITPIGALAGIMFTSLLKDFDIKYSFKDFTKNGVIIGLPVITAALLSLYLLYL